MHLVNNYLINQTSSTSFVFFFLVKFYILSLTHRDITTPKSFAKITILFVINLTIIIRGRIRIAQVLAKSLEQYKVINK